MNGFGAPEELSQPCEYNNLLCPSYLETMTQKRLKKKPLGQLPSGKKPWRDKSVKQVTYAL